MKVIRVGLTGGIGSGKTTVGGMLARLGAAVMDADAIARAVTAPGGAAIEAIAQAFGPAFITAEGALDRAHMRELAFSDPTARQRLEAIVHPLVGQQTQQQAQQAIDGGAICIVFDIPLLVESGRWRQQLDRVLVVDCSAATQVQRVMARSGLTREAVENIITAQAPRSLRLAAADCVICNDGLSLAGLEAEVTLLAKRFGL